MAEFALQRIVDVIGNTDFALADVETPVSARLAVVSALIRPGDTAASLIARARDRSLEPLLQQRECDVLRAFGAVRTAMPKTPGLTQRRWRPMLGP